jgi:hypothetical protein
MSADTNIPPNDWRKELPKLKQIAASEAVMQAVEQVQQRNEAWTIALCEIAIHAWRAQRRMKDRHSGEVKEEHKATHRNIEGILNTLESVGFTLRDREGEGYDYGLPEKVIASEKRPGISREIVAETIRPSIFYTDQLIKPGEIVIATPEEIADSKPPEEAQPANHEASKP